MLENDQGFVEVKRVVWSGAGNDSCIYDCWVQLLCETVTNITTQEKKRKRALSPKEQV